MSLVNWNFLNLAQETLTFEPWWSLENDHVGVMETIDRVTYYNSFYLCLSHS